MKNYKREDLYYSSFLSPTTSNNNNSTTSQHHQIAKSGLRTDTKQPPHREIQTSSSPSTAEIMPSRVYIVDTGYSTPINDYLGLTLLQDLVAAKIDHKRFIMDAYFVYRLEVFFYQTQNTLQDLRDAIKSVKQRDPQGLSLAAIDVLTNICDRMVADGAHEVIKQLDDRRPDGMKVWRDAWQLWNVFCQCIQEIQAYDGVYLELFKEVDQIPREMVDQFYVDINKPWIPAEEEQFRWAQGYTLP